MEEGWFRTFSVNCLIMLAYSGACWFGASLYGDHRADLVVVVHWLVLWAHLIILLVMAKTDLLGSRTEDADNNIMSTLILMTLAGHLLLVGNALQHAHIN